MDAYIGEIRIWPGTKAPTNWAFCDGSALSVRDYQALFSLIGVTYGGDGVNQFNLPNLKGRLPIHQGQGAGLTNRSMGQTAGALTVTLTAANMPVHTHTVSAVAIPATANTPNNNMLATACPGYMGYEETGHGETVVQLNAAAVSTEGGSGQPHSNMMPTLSLNYIICVNQGLYPTHN